MIRIGEKEIGRNKPVFITAELGTAHGGSISKATDLIHAARDSGSDGVKFQWVIAREILHPLTGNVELPGGPVSLYSRFEELEQPFEFYAELKKRTEAAGLHFLCSPFGMESLAGLKALGVQEVKIASPELNHYPLLQGTGDFQTIILSTGVSRTEDIRKAVDITGEATLLLHCITSYPAPEEEYNLKTLPFLAESFNLPVGISDHSMDPELVPCLSVISGGCFIEKHFTLSRKDGGLDDPIALTPQAFTRMVASVRQIEKLGPEEGLSRMKEQWGRERIESILGSCLKELAPSEAANYLTTNRSIHALTEILPGAPLTKKNTAILRTEKNLSPGLFPDHWDEILGKKAKKKIPSGEGILFDMLE